MFNKLSKTKNQGVLCLDPREEGRYVQAGVITGEVNCGEAGLPSVYADVGNLVCWIDWAVTALLKHGHPSRGYVSYFGFGSRC